MCDLYIYVLCTMDIDKIIDDMIEYIEINYSNIKKPAKLIKDGDILHESFKNQINSVNQNNK